MRLIREDENSIRSEDNVELDYFFDIIDQFLNAVKDKAFRGEDKILTLIARSPNSNIVIALEQFSEHFSEHGIELRVIFNQIAPAESLCDWLDPDNSPCGKNPEKCIRWSGQTNLDDAHEQLALGEIMSWTGESMRRESNARYGYYILNENCVEAARLAQRSFKALWHIAKSIPESQNNRAKLASANSLCLENAKSNISLSIDSTIYIPIDNTRH